MICSDRVFGSMIKRERSSMINRKKCHGDPDLERKHYLCSIKERKSSMIKREKCHGDLRSKAPLLWYNFLCLHDKKFHDKYLTLSP